MAAMLAIGLLTLAAFGVFGLVRSTSLSGKLFTTNYEMIFVALAGLLLAGWTGSTVFYWLRAQLSQRTEEAPASGRYFEAMFKQVAVGMALIGPDGRWLRVNDRFCAMVAKSREELIGERFETITHPDDVADDLTHLDDFLTGRQDQCNSEKRYLLASGDVVWANVSAVIVRDADGAPGFIAKVIEDITDRKTAEARLIRAKRSIARFFDSAADAIVIVDKSGLILSANPAVRQIFGYEPEEIVGRSFSMLMPKDAALKHDPFLANNKKAGKRAVIGIAREVEGFRKDGTVFPLDLSVTEWRQEGESYYTGIMRDITERRDAVEALAKSEMGLRLVQDATGIGSFDWNLVTGEFVGNENFYQIVGTPREGKLSPDDVLLIIHPEDRERVATVYLENLASGTAMDLEYRLDDQGSGLRWVRSIAMSILDANGKPVRRVGVILDITSKMAAEATLRENEEWLRLALNAGNLGIWSFDPRTEILKFDHLAKVILGTDSNHLKGTDAFKALLHPEGHVVFDTGLRQLEAGSTVLDEEFRLLRDDGIVRWIHVNGMIDRFARPGSKQLIGVVGDVTDRKVAEESLRENEKRLRLALAAGNMGTWSLDTTTGHLDLDSIARKIFDVELDRTPNFFEIEQIIHPDDRARFAKLQKDIKASSPTNDVEYRFLQRDGSFRWIRHAGTLIRDEESGGTRMIGINWDVTNQREAEERVRESEERLRLALASGHFGTWSADTTTGQVELDAIARKIFDLEPGWNPDLAQFTEVVHPDDRAYFADQHKNIKASSPTLNIEYRCILRDGSFRWLQGTGTLVADEASGRSRVIGISWDVTEQREINDRLRKGKERLRLTLASGQFGTWSADTATGQVELDAIARKIFDLKPGWNPNLAEFTELVHPDDRAYYDEQHKDIKTSSPTLNIEYRCILRDGSFRWLQGTGTLVADEASGRSRVIGISWDVTEQREINDRLRKGEERLRLALAAGNMGTWSVDTATGCIDFDSIARKIFDLKPGWNPNLFIVDRFIHPEDRARFAKHQKDIMASSPTLDIEYRFRQRDGSFRWIRNTGTLIRDEETGGTRMIGINWDVTDRRVAEERMRALRNEFAHLARVNDLGEMAAAIAHEINQPLTAISNYLSAGLGTARKSAGASGYSDTEEMMERAAEQAQRAGQIVRRLREFIGKGTGERETRSADQLVDAATELATVDAKINGVTVVRNAGAGDALVSVDVIQIQQVVVNLIRNAIDALSTNSGGVERRLTVETKIGESSTTVEFMVADTGPGIAKEVSAKLFEPFTTSKLHGMGMGLSISKRLIEAHGGSIWVESPSSGGAAFHFELPIEPIAA